MSKSKLSILRSAMMISVFGTASSLLAFIVQLILAKSFGASFRMDAYFAAVGVPRVIMRLLGLPLNQVFVPLFKELEAKDHSGAAQFASSLFWGLFVFFAIIGVGVFAFSTNLAQLIIPGSDTETIRLTASILKALSLYVLFAGMYFTTTAIHVAHKSFGPPYFANMISNAVVVGYTFVFIQQQGIFAAVYGLTLGAFVQASINLLTMPTPLTITPRIPKRVAKSFFALFVPLAIGSFIYRSTPLIDRYFASFLPEGNISIIGYGLQILESVVAFLSSGLSIVLLPISSELSARNDNEKLSHMLSWGIRAVLLLAIPTMTYIGIFGETFVGALFERGSFTSITTTRVAIVLLAYLGAFAALAIGAQMTNMFYAKKKHLLVVIVNLVLLPLYIFLLYTLTRKIGVTGIALSYSVYTVLTVLVYIILLKKIVPVEYSRIWETLWRTLLGSAMMVGTLLLLAKYSTIAHTHLIYLGLQVAVGATAYFMTLYILRSKEVHMMITYATKLLKK